jgi:hypothetical protein
MPQTINTTYEGQIIGGIFSSEDNADKAVVAFKQLGLPTDNIQVVIKQNNTEAQDTYTTTFLNRGFSESQALYHNKVIREGKILVIVYEVTDPGPIIEIFDRYNAEHNPNGSRNLRNDVAVMTAGAVVGATVGGVVGAAIGGPVGAAVGATAGAFVGGSGGAAAGQVVENLK